MLDAETNKSRLLIAGLAGVCVLILVATPYRTLVAREFPQLNLERSGRFQLALLPAEKADLETAPQKEEEKEVEIRLPLSVSGLGAESIAAIDGFMVDLEAQDGLHWNSVDLRDCRFFRTRRALGWMLPSREVLSNA